MNPENTRRNTPPPAGGPPPLGGDSGARPPPTAQPARDPEDPRTRAAKRAAEINEHIGDTIEQGEDIFYIDPRAIPDGWCYEWKRHTLLGKEDPSYEVKLAQKGWEAVPRSRHPTWMPDNYTGETILREGQILMERPQTITDRVKAQNDRAAREQVRGKEQQLGGAPPGTFERANKSQPMASINKTFEHIPIPKE